MGEHWTLALSNSLENADSAPSIRYTLCPLGECEDPLTPQLFSYEAGHKYAVAMLNVKLKVPFYGEHWLEGDAQTSIFLSPRTRKTTISYCVCCH